MKVKDRASTLLWENSHNRAKIIAPSASHFNESHQCMNEKSHCSSKYISFLDEENETVN